MKNEFCTYEQALAVKELGFDEHCWCYFMNGIFNPSLILSDYEYLNQMPQEHIEFVLAPLYQQVFRFFREKHDMCSFIQRFEGRVYDYEITSDIFKEITDFKDGYFDTYQEAELACLKKLIEIVKNK